MILSRAAPLLKQIFIELTKLASVQIEICMMNFAIFNNFNCKKIYHAVSVVWLGLRNPRPHLQLLDT